MTAPTSVPALLAALAAPMYALPLDAFRVLAGLVTFGYFVRTLLETPDFSSPDGLIDHPLAQRLLPPTRLGFFQPGLPAWLFRAVLTLACLASLFLAVGYQPRLAAVFLFLVAVSTYRWNMLVTYVDDAIMHLVLFWLMLSPVGTTLTLQGLIVDGSASFESWSNVTVAGGTTRLFLVNLAIAYFVAGAYKWTSPMWRDGSALYAIVKLPISITPQLWKPSHFPAFRLTTYFTLVTEPLFPLMFVLPAGSVAKWIALAMVVGFHVGIIATLRIPFANLAMLGAVPIVLHDELMRALFGRSQPAMVPGPGVLGPSEFAGLALVACLSCMVLYEVVRNGRLTSPPLWKTSVGGFRRNPMCIVLWCAGIAQSYRLFDWIDMRNYHARYELIETRRDGSLREIESTNVFPRAIRHLLLQSYLHGSIWHQIHPAGLRELRRTILERYARRYAKRRRESGTIEVYAVRQRVTARNLRLDRGVRARMLRFMCVDGDAVVESAWLDPESASQAVPAPVELEPSAAADAVAAS